VSEDSLARHDKFRDKHDLDFVLLSDDKPTVHEKYGAWGEKKMYGKTVQSVIRSTFLIDEDGKIAKAWRNPHSMVLTAALRMAVAEAPSESPFGGFAVSPRESHARSSCTWP
jgi:peroxiredoxin